MDRLFLTLAIISAIAIIAEPTPEFFEQVLHVGDALDCRDISPKSYTSARYARRRRLEATPKQILNEKAESITDEIFVVDIDESISLDTAATTKLTEASYEMTESKDADQDSLISVGCDISLDPLTFDANLKQQTFDSRLLDLVPTKRQDRHSCETAQHQIWHSSNQLDAIELLQIAHISQHYLSEIDQDKSAHVTSPQSCHVFEPRARQHMPEQEALFPDASLKLLNENLLLNAYQRQSSLIIQELNEDDLCNAMAYSPSNVMAVESDEPIHHYTSNIWEDEWDGLDNNCNSNISGSCYPTSAIDNQSCDRDQICQQRNSSLPTLETVLVALVSQESSTKRKGEGTFSRRSRKYPKWEPEPADTADDALSGSTITELESDEEIDHDNSIVEGGAEEHFSSPCTLNLARSDTCDDAHERTTVNPDVIGLSDPDHCPEDPGTSRNSHLSEHTENLSDLQKSLPQRNLTESTSILKKLSNRRASAKESAKHYLIFTIVCIAAAIAVVVLTVVFITRLRKYIIYRRQSRIFS